MRQTITLTLSVDVDYDAAKALPMIPGHAGPDPEPPISGLDMMMTDLRADILEWVAENIKEGHDLARVGPITLGCQVDFGQPYTPTYESF